MRGDELFVLLVQRKDAPFKGLWALPGGFVNENEKLERAAARELREETGMTGARLEQLGAFGDPGRDPRGHTVSVVYLTFLQTEAKLTAGDDASAAQWQALHAPRPNRRPEGRDNRAGLALWADGLRGRGTRQPFRRVQGPVAMENHMPATRKTVSL